MTVPCALVMVGLIDVPLGSIVTANFAERQKRNAVIGMGNWHHILGALCFLRVLQAPSLPPSPALCV